MQNEKMTATRIDMVDGTPFNVATFTEANDNEEITTCRIAVGNQIASAKLFESYDDAVNYINEKPWELMCAVFSIIAQKYVGKN